MRQSMVAECRYGSWLCKNAETRDGAGVEASGLRGKHESLSKKPAVEPATRFQPPVHREEGGNRRVKKIRIRAIYRSRASISVRSMPSAP
jgi:hypothetical protein